MASFTKHRSEAAKWIYERRDAVTWWRWTVLTSHNNNDPATLKIPDKDAFLIFADLVHDGLLVPVVASDGHEAYTINPGKDDKWKQYAHPCRYWLTRNMWQMIGWIISGLIGAGLGAIINAMIT